MCLISVLGKGTLKNGEKVEKFIENGMRSQRDGSGFAYKRDGEKEITLSKAYFNLASIIKDINNANLTINDELIIHHRTSTGGNDEQLNTHPFVITPKFEDITVIDAVVKKPVMAHNGIFWNYSEKIDKTFNDTVHWIHIWMNNPYFLNMIKNDPNKFKEIYGSMSNLGTSKLAFIFPDKGIVMLGDYTEDEGYFHSNGSYKDWSATDRGGVSCSRGVGFWNWGDDNIDTESVYPSNKNKSRAFVLNNFNQTNNDSYLKSDLCMETLGIIKKEYNSKFGLYSSEKFLKLTKNTAHCYYFKKKSGSTEPSYFVKDDSNINSFTTTLTNSINKYESIIVSTSDLVEKWEIRKVVEKYEDIFNDIYLLKRAYGEDISNKKKKKLINWYNTSFQKKRPKVKLNGKTESPLIVSTSSLGLYLDNLINKPINRLQVVS